MPTSIISRPGTNEDCSSVKIAIVNGKIQVSGNIRTLAKETEKGLSCYITGFDIYFFAKDKESRRKKALTFVKFYLDNFLLFSNKNSLRKLALDLNKKGFKADNHNLIMHELVNNKHVPANFKTIKQIEPNNFAGASVFSENFEVAA